GIMDIENADVRYDLLSLFLNYNAEQTINSISTIHAEGTNFQNRCITLQQVLITDVLNESKATAQNEVFNIQNCDAYKQFNNLTTMINFVTSKDKDQDTKNAAISEYEVNARKNVSGWKKFGKLALSVIPGAGTIAGSATGGVAGQVAGISSSYGLSYEDSKKIIQSARKYAKPIFFGGRSDYVNDSEHMAQTTSEPRASSDNCVNIFS
ncbi:hypothetical protein L3V82_13325, partial [Thiotrichales bacterium 19S3-7]|nr:hypothetical protein [Thiotrichales bacterium 19S3-7]MCF6803149.1 hypothetical protein [Thiotrichales bacterium 19S3-11]